MIVSRLPEHIQAQDKRALTSPANGRLAKGPIDTSITRFNAIKHGLRAQEVVLTDESEEEFGEFTDAIREDLNPCGVVQEQLADRIVMGFWRLRRVERAERKTFMELTGMQEILEQESPYYKVFSSNGIEKIGQYEGRISNKLHKNIAFLKVLQAQGKKED